VKERRVILLECFSSFFVVLSRSRLLLLASFSVDALQQSYADAFDACFVM
jgi:hypothetical protein